MRYAVFKEQAHFTGAVHLADITVRKLQKCLARYWESLLDFLTFR